MTSPPPSNSDHNALRKRDLTLLSRQKVALRTAEVAALAKNSEYCDSAPVPVPVSGARLFGARFPVSVSGARLFGARFPVCFSEGVHEEHGNKHIHRAKTMACSIIMPLCHDSRFVLRRKSVLAVQVSRPS